jgi:hypothetical protein
VDSSVSDAKVWAQVVRTVVLQKFLRSSIKSVFYHRQR